MKKQSGFLLCKRYLDCVSDDGSVFIGYAASLRWSGLLMNYSSILQVRYDKEVEIDITLQEFSVPQVADSCIQWSSSHLNIAGTWKAIAQPIKRTLLESSIGSIEWNCLHPHARA